MNLAKDFTADFDKVVAGLLPDYYGLPYAFARYGDGEAAIMFNRKHQAKSDGWSWVPGAQGWHTSRKLRESLAYSQDGWHVGISSESHHPVVHSELLQVCGSPNERVTFAELFSFANYRRFRALDLSRCFTIGPRKCDMSMPHDAILRNWDATEVVQHLIKYVKQPIIVAGGPMANILIHEYWKATEVMPRVRRVIVDVGSALSFKIHDRRTRQYHNPSHHLHGWKPQWKVDKGSS